MLYLKEIIIVIVLAAVVLGTGVDIWTDYRAGASTAHLTIELVIVLALAVLIAAVAVSVRRQAREFQVLKESLSQADHTASAASAASADFAAARHGLARAARSQFEKWQLTETEQEVAMLLLKGLSFKEIAAVRDSAEKTVRQHASSIYRKAGVAGRHAFSAWFIEDFL